MMLSLLIVAVFAGCQVELSHEVLATECSDGETLLSQNRSLAPLSLVEASSDISVGRATNVYNFGYDGDSIDTWCAYNSDPEIRIELGFTSPIVITTMISSGRIGYSTITESLGMFYVTNFTLEYSTSSISNFTFYVDEDNNQKYFETPELNTLIRFEPPLLTQRIRLRPVAWIDTDETTLQYVCQGVAIYGCLPTEAIDITTTTLGRPLETVPVTTTAATEEGGMDDQLVVIKDNQVVAIVLPIALLTIIINTAIVGVGVFLCRFHNGRNKKKDHPHSYVNLDMSTKSFKRKETEQTHTNSESFCQQTSIVKKVDNPIYGSSPVSQSEVGIKEDEHIYTSASETGYEPIDPTASSKDKDSDMLYNQAYGDVGAKSEASEQEAHYDVVRNNERYTSPALFDGDYAKTAIPPSPVGT